ncbi:MAG: ABC transporter substrate-binding protein [Phycisphaerae bacterium]|nr:MAG: ABC transporter substrate-binding protein [Planctomycetota bacterium]KAB2945315.1 MAG: ABC transporter substrate-binding protein [Phycisphaerae bacterium]MBE7458872.1 ABC transporter substrate-binding protein [Planctomycetia bacterium]MCK6466128.1 ABC transporter substrate-binding protein [Phycisphaerae bacterium]MCL4720071.1 ABC transporter substrate-binding protein [Phycisphaerae bacterium]
MNRHLTLGHSPDPDDAFMFYGLAANKVDARGWTFEHILQDIQTLNERALRAELDITAVSIHAFPFIADRYALTNCGSSMGDGYGPMIVAREPLAPDRLRGALIAVPGEMTTAYLAVNLALGRGSFRHRVIMFDQILDAVAAGEADAGLIIHEGQLTYRRHGLHCVIDLGAWWKERTGLPLPLGGNAIRKDLGAANLEEIAAVLKSSIEYGLAHRTEAVEHALKYGRDLLRDQADRFVGMYVNHWTVDYGDAGREAVRELLRQAHVAGLTPETKNIRFVG